MFRVFLTSDLTHAAIIERSGPIKVTTNREYHLESFLDSVPPCHENEVVPINVRQPKCSAIDDKIRVYGQGTIRVFYKPLLLYKKQRLFRAILLPNYISDSNEAKIRVAEYSTILFQ